MSNKTVGRVYASGVAFCLLLGSEGTAKDFDEFEIRVIRPRYFTKKGLVEFSPQFMALTNQTFDYGMFASLSLSYNFNESFAACAEAWYGGHIAKDQTRTLKNKFGIDTNITQLTQYVGPCLKWTPMYGKQQLPYGNLVYFDTFVKVGGGIAQIVKASGACNSRVAAPAGLFGLGQRLFLSKNTSAEVGIIAQRVVVPANETCGEQSLTNQDNVFLNVGLSYFMGR